MLLYSYPFFIARVSLLCSFVSFVGVLAFTAALFSILIMVVFPLVFLCFMTLCCFFFVFFFLRFYAIVLCLWVVLRPILRFVRDSFHISEAHKVPLWLD